MPMKYESEILHQTSDFDSFQMLPRSVLSLGMASWAGIVKSNLHSFPKLIQDHNLGVVVVRTNITYHMPYEFFSGESFKVSIEMCLTEDKKNFIWDVAFLGSSGERFVSLEAVGRAVKIDPTSWGAAPTTIEPPILGYFNDGDYHLQDVSRPVENRLKTLKNQEPIVQNEVRKRIYRHECEAADQWSFIEIGTNAANAREELLLESNPPEDKIAQVKGLLNRPLTKINTLIKRPLFLFDHYTIRSALYQTEGEYHVVHRYMSDMGRAKEHAIVIESYKEY